MRSLVVLALLVAAASAVPVDLVKKDDKVLFRCTLNTWSGKIIVKDVEHTTFHCISDDSSHFYLAADPKIGDKFDAFVDKETVAKMKDANIRTKRQFGGFGGGGGFSQAGAQASSGSFGGGGGFGGPFGGGLGGGFSGSNAYSSANSGSFGGGGFLG